VVKGILVVDAMNVIGSRPDGWWRDRDGAARRLVGRVQALARDVDEDVTIVLDGRPLDDLPEGVHDGVRVLYARRSGRDAADDRIVELVEGLDVPGDATVVTSDRELGRRVRELGATTTGAGSFLARLDAE
jgi:predicted RNA-binding protein with PIN domain